MANDLYVHTIDIRNWISPNEAQRICELFNAPYEDTVVITNTKITGINQLTMKRNKFKTKDKLVDRFNLEIRINLGRLLKISSVGMILLNHKTVNALIEKLNKILLTKFALNTGKIDSEKWHIKRLDCGFDLELYTDDPNILREYIKVLHDSFDHMNYRNISYSKYKTNKNSSDIRYESITLTTSGEGSNAQRYKYNIYYKLQQLLDYASDQGISLTEKEKSEIEKVIRIEKQIYDFGKVTKNRNQLSTLLDENVTEKLMDGIVNDLKILFGQGDYLTDLDALGIIFTADYSEDLQEKLSVFYESVKYYGYRSYVEIEVALLKTQSKSNAEIEAWIKQSKEYRMMLEEIGISVAASDIGNSLININTLIEEQCNKTKKPRAKKNFAEVFECKEPSGKSRYKCNPSLRQFDGSKKRTSLASSVGGSREECEN
ncbi:MAG: hypothetical protein AB7V50_11515, partial [Vampirovibrionia bacterium]